MKEIYQIWYKLFKVVGEHYPEELLDFIFQGKKPQFQGKFEQERIVLEYQIADINFWVKENGVKKLLNIEPYSTWNRQTAAEVLNIEPYSTWNRQTAAEVFTRNAIITKSLDYQYDVVSVVVLLDSKEEIGIYETGLGKHENRFHFSLVNFADVKGILKKYPPLAPFLLKMYPKYQEDALKVIKNQKLLKYVTVLILSYLGIPEEEALNMTQANLEEFRELMEIPIMQSLLKDMEAKAEDKERKKIAKNLLKAKVDKKIIVKVTGLSLEEINKIKKK